jgi:hypothetical protein
MDAGAHAVGSTELRHPDEHVDAQFLRPGKVNGGHVGVQDRNAECVTVYDCDEDKDGRSRHQAGDQRLFQSIENAKHDPDPPQFMRASHAPACTCNRAIAPFDAVSRESSPISLRSACRSLGYGRLVSTPIMLYFGGRMEHI